MGNLSQFKQKLSVNNTDNRFKFVKSYDFKVKLQMNLPPNVANFSDLARQYYHRGISNGLVSEIRGEFYNDFDFFVTGVDLPNFKHSAKEISNSDAEQYSATILANDMFLPQERSITFTLIDTVDSIMESFITPWMQMNASPVGTVLSSDEAYASSFGPVITATISVISFWNKGGNIVPIRVYNYHGAKPVSIDSPNFSHSDSDIVTRDVEFSFSSFSITKSEQLQTSVTPERKALANENSPLGAISLF